MPKWKKSYQQWCFYFSSFISMHTGNNTSWIWWKARGDIEENFSCSISMLPCITMYVIAVAKVFFWTKVQARERHGASLCTFSCIYIPHDSTDNSLNEELACTVHLIMENTNIRYQTWWNQTGNKDWHHQDQSQWSSQSGFCLTTFH